MHHRFIWECFNGVIPDEKVIYYIDINKTNNKLVNLQYITQKENCMKSANNWNYSFNKYIRTSNRLIKATCVESVEINNFHSMYSVQRGLCINCGMVKMCCEGINRAGVSKLNGNSFKFEYIDVLPHNYNRKIKIANIIYKYNYFLKTKLFLVKNISIF